MGLQLNSTAAFVASFRPDGGRVTILVTLDLETGSGIFVVLWTGLWIVRMRDPSGRSGRPCVHARFVRCNAFSCREMCLMDRRGEADFSRLSKELTVGLPKYAVRSRIE